jgi:hypothetical protein
MKPPLNYLEDEQPNGKNIDMTHNEKPSDDPWFLWMVVIILLLSGGLTIYLAIQIK